MHANLCPLNFLILDKTSILKYRRNEISKADPMYHLLCNLTCLGHVRALIELSMQVYLI